MIKMIENSEKNKLNGYDDDYANADGCDDNTDDDDDGTGDEEIEEKN